MKKLKKKKTKIPKCLLDEYRKTTDQWYPNYDGNKVHVRATLYPPGSVWDDEHRAQISVWGADDDGMEKWYSSLDKMKQDLKRVPAVITKKQLFILGFEQS